MIPQKRAALPLAFEKDAARGSARAKGAHVCGLRSVFRHAHVAAENGSKLFAPCAAQTLRDFLLRCAGRKSAMLFGANEIGGERWIF